MENVAVMEIVLSASLFLTHDGLGSVFASYFMYRSGLECDIEEFGRYCCLYFTRRSIELDRLCELLAFQLFPSC